MKFIAIVFTVILSSFSNSYATENISVRLPIPVIEAGQTPFYVAHDKGYYAEEGLNVNFHLGSKELNPIKMVVSNQDDFGVLGGPDTLLVAKSKGHDLKAVAILHRNSNFPVILTLKDSGITKIKDLRGKKVGFFYGHISTDVLRNLFRKENVEITEIDTGFDYKQLITGQIDASWAFRVTAGLNLPAKGVEINTITPADYGIDTHGYTIFVTEETAKSKPETIRKFLRATVKGIKYCLSNPEHAIESLFSRNPNLIKELSLTRLKKYNEVTSNSLEYPIGHMDNQMFKETYDRLLEEGVIEKAFDVKEAFSSEFLK